MGLRYGHGELVYKGVPSRKVYWQGPSIGFGVNYVRRNGTAFGQGGWPGAPCGAPG